LGTPNVLPSKRYGAIYADPPWLFRTYSAKGTGRSAVSHYDCLEFTDLKSLPVGDLAAKNCALFLWATDPLLPNAIELLEAWGFTYKTVAFCWAKLNKSVEGTLLRREDFFTGLGYWTRANGELCLLGTRGKPIRKSKDVRRLVIERRREHSRKPDEVASRIEKLVHGPYLELFARQTRDGWDVWGDQTSLFDNGSVPTRRQLSDLTQVASMTLCFTGAYAQG
jgi:N6-adenosine-specific RNA methylase IME4